jgi:hypothetical protein
LAELCALREGESRTAQELGIAKKLGSEIETAKDKKLIF